MKYKTERDGVEAALNAEEKIEGEPKKINLGNKSMVLVDNPRSGKCLFMLGRIIYKFFRIVHVSFFFYFAPFLMLVYQFYLNTKNSNEK